MSNQTSELTDEERIKAVDGLVAATLEAQNVQIFGKDGEVEYLEFEQLEDDFIDYDDEKDKDYMPSAAKKQKTSPIQLRPSSSSSNATSKSATS